MLIIKAAALHMFFLVLISVSVGYVRVLKNKNEELRKSKSTAVNVMIRVFSDKGEVWRVTGSKLISAGQTLELLKVFIVTEKGYTISSDYIKLFRNTKVAHLEGNIEISGEDTIVKTEKAVVEFDKGLVKGNSRVYVEKNITKVNGQGFTAFLNPLRVIINRVKTEHDI